MGAYCRDSVYKPLQVRATSVTIFIPPYSLSCDALQIASDQ